MSENTLDVKKIKKLAKDPNAILKLGLILVILGVVLGACASYVANVGQAIGVAVMQTGQVILLVGVLFFVYYFLVFFNVKKKELLCVHCGKEIRGEVKFCPHCGKDIDTAEEDKDKDKNEENDEKED